MTSPLLLRDYQKTAISSLWQCFRENPKARPLLVCPTGSGKSVLVAEIIRQLHAKRKDWRILVVTHRKEIVEQNARKYTELTGEPCGIMSAGLNKKFIRKVTFANVQSIYRNPTDWDIVLVDEAHLISGKADSMYGKLFAKSNARIIGLTATPYRMDHGFLIGPGTLFTHVAYEISIADLIAQEFLAPLVSVPRQEIDTSNINFRGFDFAAEELEAAALEHIGPQAEDILEKTANRKHVLVFCSGVNHAQQMAAILGGECVHGGLVNFERDRIISRFKDGHNKYLTNCDILTTGFDFPAIDCVVLIRPTQSTGLYVQMVGRGSRIAPNKQDCLILDYGGNIRRHGPIDCIEVDFKEKDPKFSLAPLKSCSECGCVVNIRIMTCPACGAPFPSGSDKYTPVADTAPILSQSGFEVVEVTHRIHYKVGGLPSLRVDYHLEFNETISDFWCFSHEGFARQKACQNWVKLGGQQPAPRDTEEAFARHHELMLPTRIEGKKDGKYWRVTKILEVFKPQEIEDDLSMPNI